MNGDSLYGALPIPLQNLACTYAGWQRARMRYTPYFHQTLASWMESGWSSEEALRSLQQARLISLVERAREAVPHYASLDVPPPVADSDPVTGIEKILDAFPVLEKTVYRDAPELFLSKAIDHTTLIKGKTSGTTGMALPLWYTREAVAEEFVAVWRLRVHHGIQLGDPHLTLGGRSIVPLNQIKAPFWRRNSWAKQTLFSLYHMSVDNLPAYVDAIHETAATYIQGYPSSFYLLGRAMLEQGRPLPKGKFKAVLPSSESLLAFHVEVITAAFNAPILDRYGASELAVSMTGCREGHLHVDMEFGIVEVEVEEETDEWVRGPLVVTGFANDATPLIRYKIGDVGTRSKQPCACGRPGDVFLDVDGRVEDYVVTPDGRWIGRLDHIFKEQRDIAEAQILQDEADAIEVRLIRQPSFSDDSEAKLLREIRSRLGNDIRIDLNFVDEIPREANGKFRAVKSRVGRNG